MSFNGRYIGKDLIAKRLKSRYGLTMHNDEIKDDIDDAIRAIGHYNAYVLKVTDGKGDNPDPIQIINYRGMLPRDIEYPIMARDYDSKTSMSCINNIYNNEEVIYIPGSSITYDINYYHIITNIEKHKVEFAYLGFPTDKDNNPLVPDHEEYIKAIVAYCADVKATNLYIKGEIDERRQAKIEQDWYAYAIGAVSIEMPNMDHMDKLADDWLQLLPKKGRKTNNGVIGILDQTKPPNSEETGW